MPNKLRVTTAILFFVLTAVSSAVLQAQPASSLIESKFATVDGIKIHTSAPGTDRRSFSCTAMRRPLECGGL
jgi:hypothetical protein